MLSIPHVHRRHCALECTQHALPLSIKCRLQCDRVTFTLSRHSCKQFFSSSQRPYVVDMHARVQRNAINPVPSLDMASPRHTVWLPYSTQHGEQNECFSSAPFENPKPPRISVCWVSIFAHKSPPLAFIQLAFNTVEADCRRIHKREGSATILARAAVSSHQQNEFR